MTFQVGDRVRFNYGYPAPGDAMTGTVTAVRDLPAGDHGEPENQILTIDWIVVTGITVAATKEYAQDVVRVEARSR